MSWSNLLQMRSVCVCACTVYLALISPESCAPGQEIHLSLSARRDAQLRLLLISQHDGIEAAGYDCLNHCSTKAPHVKSQ